MKTFGQDEIQDLIIVGVGPPALVGLREAQVAGLKAIGIDKGPVCGALVKHPAYMKWFSTADKLELCGMPLLVSDKSPTRREYLKYCRSIVSHFGLEIVTYNAVTSIVKDGELFSVTAADAFGRETEWKTHNVAVGTGFYDSPRPLGIPGEDLPHVSHVYQEPHLYFDQDVVVIGGGSSAAETALELWRENAGSVTVVLRSERFHTKFWVEPDIENRIKEGSIAAYRNAEVKEIRPDEIVILAEDGSEFPLPADFILAMTGYEPDTSMLRSVGAEVDDASNKPALNDRLETTVPGLYVLGTLCAGIESNVVFIENSRDHGPKIVHDIVRKRAAAGERV